MQFEQLSYLMFWTYITGYLSSWISVFFGGFLYDFKQIKNERNRSKNLNSGIYKHRPEFLVIIYAQNDVNTIETCIKSIIKSSYKNKKIIVINHASTDSIKAKANKIIRAFPKKQIKLINSRASTDKKKIIKRIVDANSASDLIALIPANGGLGKKSLSNAWYKFADDEFVGSVVLKSKFKSSLHVRDRLLEIRLLNNQNKKKLLDFLSGYTKQGIRHNSVYKRSVLINLLKNNKDKHKIVYAEDAMFIFERPAKLNNSSLMFNFIFKNEISAITSLFRVLVVGYTLYLAIVQQTPLPLALVWGTFVVSHLISIYWDKDYSIAEKLYLSTFVLTQFLLEFLNDIYNIFYIAIFYLKNVSIGLLPKYKLK